MTTLTSKPANAQGLDGNRQECRKIVSAAVTTHQRPALLGLFNALRLFTYQER